MRDVCLRARMTAVEVAFMLFGVVGTGDALIMVMWRVIGRRTRRRRTLGWDDRRADTVYFTSGTMFGRDVLLASHKTLESFHASDPRAREFEWFESAVGH